MDDRERWLLDCDLARLRRLYHHAVHGGVFNERDEQFVGTWPTRETIADAIKSLEGKQRRKEVS